MLFLVSMEMIMLSFTDRVYYTNAGLRMSWEAFSPNFGKSL